MKFISKFSILFWLIAISFFVKSFVAFNFGDQNIDNEWGILVENLTNYKTLSFYRFNEQNIPSVYMPPAYVFFLYLIKLITFEKLNFVSLIIFFQVLISTYSVYIFYNLNQKIFSNFISLINSFIFSFFPLNLYVAGQISSITFQVFLSLLFLKYLFYLFENQTQKNVVIFSFISGVLILTRGEFILIYIITFLYLLFIKKISLKILIKILLISSLTISPYIIRNFVIFDEIVIVKSSGFNLWKGNNQIATVEGTPSVHPPNTFEEEQWKYLKKPEFAALKNKLDSIKIDKYYEINRDKIFLEEAKNNLVEDPYKYFELFLKKIFSYYFIDLKSSYPKYYNFLHFFPIIIFSILSFPGFMIALKEKSIKHKYLIIYLSINLIIFSIFFILPRYKLIILPIQIILAAYFVQYVLNKISSKNL